MQLDNGINKQSSQCAMTLMKIDVVLPFIILAMCIGNIYLPVCNSSIALFDLYLQIFILAVLSLTANSAKIKGLPNIRVLQYLNHTFFWAGLVL